MAEVTRPKEEADIKYREDRVAEHFRKYLDKYAFVELSEEYLTRSKIGDIMTGVPVPLGSDDLGKFKNGAGIAPKGLANDMSFVMGCDPHFRFADKYAECINRLFADKYQYDLVRTAAEAAEGGHFDDACIYYRAALCLQPGMQDAMYGYARVCRNIYLEAAEAEDSETVGRFKAESMDYFELLTQVHPKFAPAYYYLGYAYVNMGLYIKADLTWKEYLKIAPAGKDKDEIRDRVHELRDPVLIERGCNEVIAGRFAGGIEMLATFVGTNFDKWWPLHYYLGVAYSRTGHEAEAAERFKRVLQLNASHIETMRELCSLYERSGDTENYIKYMKKIALVEENIKADD
jgi:hypothetical protein